MQPSQVSSSLNFHIESLLKLAPHRPTRPSKYHKVANKKVVDVGRSQENDANEQMHSIDDGNVGQNRTIFDEDQVQTLESFLCDDGNVQIINHRDHQEGSPEQRREANNNNEEDDDDGSAYGETFSLSAFSSLPDYHNLIDAVLEMQQTHSPCTQLQGLHRIMDFSPGDILMTDGWVGIRNQLLTLLTMPMDTSEYREQINAKRIEVHSAVMDILYSLFAAACSGNSPQTVEIALGVVRHLYIQQNFSVFGHGPHFLQSTVADAFALLIKILYDLGDKEVVPDEELFSHYHILMFLLIGRGFANEVIVLNNVGQSRQNTLLTYMFAAIKQQTEVANLLIPPIPFIERFMSSFASSFQAAIFAFQSGVLDILQEYLLQTAKASRGDRYRELKLMFATILYVKLTKKITSFSLDRKLPILCKCPKAAHDCELHTLWEDLCKLSGHGSVFDNLFGVHEVFTESEMPELGSVHSDVSSPKQTKVWNFELHHDHGLTSHMAVETEPLSSYNGIYSVMVWRDKTKTTFHRRDSPRRILYLSERLFKHLASFLIDQLQGKDANISISFHGVNQLCRTLTLLPTKCLLQQFQLLQTLVSHETLTDEINAAETNILCFDIGYHMLGGRPTADEEAFWKYVFHPELDLHTEDKAMFAPKLSVLRGLITAAVHHCRRCPSFIFAKHARYALKQMRGPIIHEPVRSSSHNEIDVRRGSRHEAHRSRIARMIQNELFSFPSSAVNVFTFDTFSLMERYRLLQRQHVESFIRSANEAVPVFAFILNYSKWSLDDETVAVMSQVIKQSVRTLLTNLALNFPEEREIETFLHTSAMLWSHKVLRQLMKVPDRQPITQRSEIGDDIVNIFLRLAFLSDAMPFFWNSAGSGCRRLTDTRYSFELGTSLLQTAAICSCCFNGYPLHLQTTLARASSVTSVFLGYQNLESIALVRSYCSVIAKDSELIFEQPKVARSGKITAASTMRQVCSKDLKEWCIRAKEILERNRVAIDEETIVPSALFWMNDSNYNSGQERQIHRAASLRVAMGMLLGYKNSTLAENASAVVDFITIRTEQLECSLDLDENEYQSNGSLWLKVFQQAYGIQDRAEVASVTYLSDLVNIALGMAATDTQNQIGPISVPTQFVKHLMDRYPQNTSNRLRVVENAVCYIRATYPMIESIVQSFYISEYIPMFFWIECHFLGHITFAQYVWLYVLHIKFGDLIWSALLVDLLYQYICCTVSKSIYVNTAMTSGEFLHSLCTPRDTAALNLDPARLFEILRGLKAQENVADA